ncbi:MAG: ComEC/Rec2 family competence protein [Patescibacteria group bacterium]|jgi:competence protein ComEC
MKIKRIILIIVILTLPALALKYSTNPSHTGLEVYFLDVGQGDAVLIRTSTGKNILIDGGPDNSILEKLGRILPYTDRKIDVIILTHPHADHLIGLNAILDRYLVNTVIYTGVNYQNNDYHYFQEIAQQKASTIFLAKAGDYLNLDDGCQLNILFPFSNISEQDFKNINNSSIVSELSCATEKILLMGDAETPVEKELMANYPDLQAKILKLGHHGSKTASSPGFIEQVNPDLAIISVGKDNKYNLPSPEVLDRLQELELKVIRTDVDKDLKIWLKDDGIYYKKPYF